MCKCAHYDPDAGRETNLYICAFANLQINHLSSSSAVFPLLSFPIREGAHL